MQNKTKQKKEKLMKKKKDTWKEAILNEWINTLFS
jgi:hypothetical protein